MANTVAAGMSPAGIGRSGRSRAFINGHAGTAAVPGPHEQRLFEGELCADVEGRCAEPRRLHEIRHQPEPRDAVDARVLKDLVGCADAEPRRRG